jgi:AcrR family transcriptional regulator
LTRSKILVTTVVGVIEAMVKKMAVREPRQSRSIQMKEKILNTAFQLFCEKGFYRTTTNEIAQTAGVSAASLYAYFKDRDAIFFEILDRYHQQFITLHQKAIGASNPEQMDKKVLLYRLIENLVNLHEQSKEFNRELKVMYYSNPKVAAIMNRQNEETQKIIMGYLKSWKRSFETEDLKVTALLCFDFTSAIVDRILTLEKIDERERIKQVGVETLLKIL